MIQLDTLKQISVTEDLTCTVLHQKTKYTVAADNRPGHWAEQPRLLLLASGSCCMFPCQSGPCQSGPCQSFQGRGLQAVLRTGTVGSIWVYRSRRTVQLNSRSPALWLINGLCLRPWLSDILHAGLLTAACVTSHLILTTSLRAGYRFTDEEAEEERV